MSPTTSLMPTTRQELRAAIMDVVAREGLACDLSAIDTRYIFGSSNMSEDSTFNGDISSWDFSNVVDAPAVQPCLLFTPSPFNQNPLFWNAPSTSSPPAPALPPAPLPKPVLPAPMSKPTKAPRAQGWSLSRLWFGKKKNPDPAEQDPSVWNTPSAQDVAQEQPANSVQPTSGTKEYVLPEHFVGIPPTLKNARANYYKQLFETPARLADYLHNTPFNGVHFEIRVVAECPPEGMRAEDYTWLQEQKEVGQSLQLDHDDLRAHVLANKHRLNPDMLSLPELDFPDKF